MNTEAVAASPEDVNTAGSPAEDHGSDHGYSDWGYIKIALFLALVTAIEVSTYFIDFGSIATPMLIVLMIVKFAFVVAVFMHLKFDNPMFTKLFMLGLLGAVAIFIPVLLTFEYF